MALEIERKYLVKDPSYRDLAQSARCIAQGYLCSDPERTVRIRIADDKGYVTVKGINTGATRNEWEYEIPVSDAQQMLKLCPRSLEKTRYIVNWEGKVWEVDEFHGRHQGLVVAEIELVNESDVYNIPPFVGDEVTGNPDYYNSNLA